MNTKKTEEFVGVDLVGNRYVMCILTSDKKNPTYASGRNDTEGGQLKFLAKLTETSEILIPDSCLAIRALQLFGEERIHIASMGSLWSAWERAGVKRGEAMAKFAAIYLIEESLPPLRLTKEQKAQIYADHALEMEQIQTIGTDASRIGEAVLKGTATSKDFDIAIRNQYQSGIKASSGSKEEVLVPLFDEDDESFLAQLYRSLEKIR
ncbi:MAG: hypothetical protein EOM68_00595 [Spirochaetia bacterium]|nr:hypothetical protein [Spirochaetia bacterium]